MNNAIVETEILRDVALAGCVFDECGNDRQHTAVLRRVYAPSQLCSVHVIEPAPERGTKTPWKAFLAAHWDGLAAADFFAGEVLTLRGLVRCAVLFVMKLKTRTVEIAGITCQPDEAWMTQVAQTRALSRMM
jgi:hypothetical protein